MLCWRGRGRGWHDRASTSPNSRPPDRSGRADLNAWHPLASIPSPIPREARSHAAPRQSNSNTVRELVDDRPTFRRPTQVGFLNLRKKESDFARTCLELAGLFGFHSFCSRMLMKRHHAVTDWWSLVTLALVHREQRHPHSPPSPLPPLGFSRPGPSGITASLPLLHPRHCQLRGAQAPAARSAGGRNRPDARCVQGDQPVQRLWMQWDRRPHVWRAGRG